MYDNVPKRVIMRTFVFFFFDNLGCLGQRSIYTHTFFYNLGCPGLRSIDMHTLTNLRGTRNTILTRVSR